MNKMQYDLIHKYLIQIEKRLDLLSKSTDVLLSVTEKLCAKTLVITDIDKDVELLKQEIRQLKDEVNI